ncbi:unnamed protein product [Orchesella dallaii]|uniref:Ionotropic glutamate receptor C-terminal domain-containing protein n=1 Tax=Orchesella dallaii TaxID=48710 RepID=A0ABP1QAT7_9HEXA
MWLKFSLLFFRIFIFISFSVALDTKQSTSAKKIHTLTAPQPMLTLVERIFHDFNGCELVFIEESGVTTNSSINLIDLDFNEISLLSAGAQQVTFGTNITFQRHEDVHRLADLHCGLAVIILYKAFDLHWETWIVDTMIPRYAPILQKDKDHFLLITPTEEISNQVLLSPSFESKIKYKLAIFNNPSSESSSELGVVCKTVDLYAKNGLPELKTLKSFNPQEITKELETQWLFPDMTKDFKGKVFRFSIPKVAFRFEIEMKQDGKWHPKRGYYKWWLDEAMRKFNFTYHIFPASFGGGTGKRLKNGTWVGATGDIFYGKADCSFIVGEIYSRHKFLGWSSSISYEWIIFMTHTPRLSYSPKAVFWPFTPLMWLLFFVSLFVVTLSLKVVSAVGMDPVTEGVEWGHTKMFGYIFSTFMEQDSKCPLKSSSIRVLCVFWLLFAMVTATAYRGKLVSLIGFPVDTWVPTTFEELANSNFKVALNVVGKAGAAYVLIASSTSPVFKTLFSRMELIPDAEVCLARAMNENLGCIIWKGIGDYAIVKNLTDKNGHVPLQDSNQIALFIGDGLVHERRAIFGEHLDRTIQAVVQMGLTIKWFQLDQEFIKKDRKAWERSTNTSHFVYDQDDGPKKLVLSQFGGVYLLCLCGILVSCGAFVREILTDRLHSAAETFSYDTNLNVDASDDKEELYQRKPLKFLNSLWKVTEEEVECKYLVASSFKIKSMKEVKFSYFALDAPLASAFCHLYDSYTLNIVESKGKCNQVMQACVYLRFYNSCQKCFGDIAQQLPIQRQSIYLTLTSSSQVDAQYYKRTGSRFAHLLRCRIAPHET